MQVVSSDASYLNEFLSTLETRVTTLTDEFDISEAFVSVASLRLFVSSTHRKSDSVSETIDASEEAALEGTVATCDTILSQLLKRASEHISKIHSFNLRRILSTLAFQAFDAS